MGCLPQQQGKRNVLPQILSAAQVGPFLFNSHSQERKSDQNEWMQIKHQHEKEKSKMYHKEDGENKNERRLETTAGEYTSDIRNQGDVRVDSGPEGSEGSGGERKGPAPPPPGTPIQIKKWPRKREGQEGGRQEG